MCAREYTYKEIGAGRDRYSWREWVKSRASRGKTNSSHKVLHAKIWVQIRRQVLFEAYIRSCDKPKFGHISASELQINDNKLISFPILYKFKIYLQNQW